MHNITDVLKNLCDRRKSSQAFSFFLFTYKIKYFNVIMTYRKKR